jgi:hypothetical protein
MDGSFGPVGGSDCESSGRSSRRGVAAAWRRRGRGAAGGGTGPDRGVARAVDSDGRGSHRNGDTVFRRG